MPQKKPPTTSSAQSAANLVDQQLARYRAMRHFDVTNEPAGAFSNIPASVESGFPFVVQKHAATRLHYDFRLGFDGVLKSWAVTKGPSYVPSDKRLAVEVEDHPMEYGGFEGVIPKGEYGGGTVMLWDQGTWQPRGNVEEDLARGQLKFTLSGTKLKGAWVLVRMGGKASHETKPNWLLIKEHDEYERKASDPAILDEQPNSVVTGRDFAQIAAEQDHTWRSHSGLEKPLKSSEPKSAQQTESIVLNIKDAPAEEFPTFLAPALAYQASTPPTGEEWLHELKLDGYRIQAHLQKIGKREELAVKLLTRNGLDWTHRMPQVARALQSLGVDSAILDGEVVVTDQSGLSSFAALQAAFQDNNSSDLLYFVFDLLHYNGLNTRVLPLTKRKAFAKTLVDSIANEDTVRFSEHFATDGAIMFHEACKLGAEGVISKLSSSQYLSGRSRSWQKSKCVLEQEFVIGGYTLPTNGSAGVGAILVGYYEGKNLRYAGKTGTGFTQQTSSMLRKRLDAMVTKESPFSVVPAEVKRKAFWVTPKLVAQIAFRTWTTDALIRQSAFKGLREDKAATEVFRERSDSEVEKGSSTPASPTTVVQHQPNLPNNKPSSALPIKLTHPDRIIDAHSGLTKQQLAEYFFEVAPLMLPHIQDRPLSIIRCPNGSGEKCFFQRHLNSSLPRGVEGVEVTDKDGKGKETYITLSTAEALLGLAQLNVLELHPWSSTNSDIEHPDRLIFDLDPDASISWKVLSDAALEVRARLKQIGLESFVKVTGGKGLHVVAPILPQHDWLMIKNFAHLFVLQMEKENPRLYLTKMTKAARKDKIYLDYLRNERSATAVAPYSPRAREGAPASIPIAWSELKNATTPTFRLVEFADWKSRLKRDPWKKLAALEQQLKLNL